MIDSPDFEAMYRSNPDPWKVRTSFYEQRKLAIVLSCLNAPRYGSAWDPACGVGELAARLAPRTDRLLATDASPQAAELTARHCRDLPQVSVRCWALPDPPPEPWRDLDLVVLSEFVYYLSAPDRAATLRIVDEVTGPEAELVLVHWRYKPHDAWLSGEDVQSEIIETMAGFGWRHHLQHDDRDFVVDALERDR